MDEASKLLTAMLTPIGIYLYNVLAMCLSNATDIFESCIHQILEGLNGVINIADEVLVYGTDYKSLKKNVLGFLDWCVEKDLHLNPDKIHINVSNVPFIGQVLTSKGLQPDPCKVDVIQQWPTPTCVLKLQSFLGSVNYLCKFIPYLSDLCQPLQELLKSSNEFVWTQVHDTAFSQLKQAICKDITLQFFDSDLPLYIEVDASKKGIGAVMLQPDKNTKNTSNTVIPNNLRPVSYASKTLTSSESNYSNIECELLGVLFSVLHFKHFTYGCKVHMIMDHKPLVSLFKKSLTSASPRLSGMSLCIIDYQLDVVYQPGTKLHLSDALSRLTSHNDNSKANAIPGLDISVHDVEVFTEMSVLSLAKIKKVTEADPDLKTLKQYINDGFPENKADCLESLRGYFNFREELAIIDGLILKGHRCVIPSALHDEALKLLHRSHMGIVKTKDRARTSFFWPNLSQDIEAYLSKCHACATYQEKQPAESLLNDPAGTKPWTALAMDNFELNGRHYLIIVDNFSKFTVVKYSQDLTSKTTINLLLEVFSEHGIPSTIRCGHGHNFISSQFIEFCKQLNIAVTLSSGYHHSSNPAECAVKTVKSLMRRCLAANTSWCIALIKYLLPL